MKDCNHKYKFVKNKHMNEGLIDGFAQFLIGANTVSETIIVMCENFGDVKTKNV